MTKVIYPTTICPACFTHFILDKPVTFKKVTYYTNRIKRMTGFQCPSCGHNVKLD